METKQKHANQEIDYADLMNATPSKENADVGSGIVITPNEQTLALNLPPINSPKYQPPRYGGASTDVKRIKMYARKDSVDSLGSTGEISMGLAMKTSRRSIRG